MSLFLPSKSFSSIQYGHAMKMYSVFRHSEKTESIHRFATIWLLFFIHMLPQTVRYFFLGVSCFQQVFLFSCKCCSVCPNITVSEVGNLSLIQLLLCLRNKMYFLSICLHPPPPTLLQLEIKCSAEKCKTSKSHVVIQKLID